MNIYNCEQKDGEQQVQGVDKKENQQVRKNFVLPNQVVKKIASLRTDMGNTTNSNVITMSVTLLDLLIEAKKNEEKIFFQDKDGKVREMTILL